MPFSLGGDCDDNLKRSLVMALTDYYYKGAEMYSYFFEKFSNL